MFDECEESNVDDERDKSDEGGEERGDGREECDRDVGGEREEKSNE